MVVPCLLVLGVLAIPRTVIVLTWIFSNYLERAYDSFLWPLLGFIFLPTTTLAWAWMTNTRGDAGGVHLIIVVLAVLLDLGLIGGGRSWFVRGRNA